MSRTVCKKRRERKSKRSIDNEKIMVQEISHCINLNVNVLKYNKYEGIAASATRIAIQRIILKWAGNKLNTIGYIIHNKILL